MTLKSKIIKSTVGGLTALVISCSPLEKEKFQQSLPPPLVSLEQLDDEAPIYYSKEDSLRVISDSLRARFEVYVDLVRTKETNILIDEIRLGEVLFIYYKNGNKIEGYIKPNPLEYTIKQQEFLSRYDYLISRIKQSFRYTDFGDGVIYDRVYSLPVGQTRRTKRYVVGLNYKEFRNE